MNPFFIFAFILLCIASPIYSHAQVVKFEDAQGATPLMWDNFKGKPDKSSPFSAMTHYSVNWKTEAPIVKEDTIVNTYTITLEFKKASWVKKGKETDELLKHEQGHYNICRIWAAELCKRFQNTTLFRKDYRAVTYSISGELMNKYRLMQLQYDKETDHSKIKEEQERWDTIIEKELSVYYP